MSRPVLFVLAGVNGAGKSSIGGHQLETAGVTWFNPDTFARELVAATACSPERANELAWLEGVRRLDAAIASRTNHAFETTLGGTTITTKIRQAAATHDVIVWFCGLSSAELHIARVQARVAAGGHDIPDEKIRERYARSILNLIELMPHLAELRVYDNSATVRRGQPIPEPTLLLEVIGGRVTRPSRSDVKALGATPDWAKALVEAALARNAR
jgi:predicted ABC-type ATPase